MGHGAPASIHVLNAMTVSARVAGGEERCPPGAQPHATSLSSRMCASMAARSLPPVARRSWMAPQRSRGLKPMKTILVSGGGRRQFGAPGGALLPKLMGKFCSWWHPAHSMAAAPRPPGPRTTFWSWTCPSSPCNGASPGIWQFWQRGCCNTERTTSNARSAPSDGGDGCAITSLMKHAPKANVAVSRLGLLALPG